MLVIIKTCVLPATCYLKEQNPKAKNVWFLWKQPFHCIFRRHVSAALKYKDCNILWLFNCTIFEKNIKTALTYYVPTILIVLPSFSLPPKILAVPKSDIFGFNSPSNKILLNFRSLCIILNLESLWRYNSPREIPSIMYKRFCQSKTFFCIGSAKTLKSKAIMHSEMQLLVVV